LDLDLVQPILEVVFQLMSLAQGNEEKQKYFSGHTDAKTPMASASQILENLLLHFPSGKLLPPLVCYITFKIFTNENRKIIPSSRPVVGLTQPPIQWVPRAPSLG
jgi:hypothetical protein